MHHQNQFLLCNSSDKPVVPTEFDQRSVTDQLDIYYFDLLPLYKASTGATTLALIGDAAVADDRDISVSKWIDETLSDVKDLDSALSAAQALTGRFALLYSEGESTTVIPDAFAHRALYYHTDRALVTSSLALLTDALNVDLSESERVAAFMDSSQFAANESAFIGDKTRYQEMRRVLPNHLLDLDTQRVSRRPLVPPDTDNLAQFIADRITDAMRSFADQYTVHAGLTAGWDSRTILACSKDIVQEISWHTVSKEADGMGTDVDVARQIATNHELPYSVYYPRPIDDSFRAEYNEFLDWTRNLPKTKTLQFLYENFDSKTDLNITGNGGGILKGYYDRPATDVNPIDHACDVLQYPENEFVRDELKEWWPDASEYAELYDIPIMDLLYWEQRMGRWGARAPREKEIAIRVVSPLSNYNLLLAGISVDRHYRVSPEYELLTTIIDSQWPALLEYEFNPEPFSARSAVYDTVPYPVDQVLKALYTTVKR